MLHKYSEDNNYTLQICLLVEIHTVFSWRFSIFPKEKELGHGKFWRNSGKTEIPRTYQRFQKCKCNSSFLNSWKCFYVIWHQGWSRARTETPLHLTDGQVNSIELTDGHVCSIGGHRWEKSGGKLFGIPFMAIGGPPVEQTWPSVGMVNFRKKNSN